MRYKLVATALATSAVIAATVPALTGAQSPGPRDLTLRLKDGAGSLVQHGKAKGARLAPGDSLVVRQAMYDTSDKRVGQNYIECTNVGAKATVERARLQCMATYALADGQIVAAGVFRMVEGAELNVAVVGGSGAYAGVSGSLTAGAPVQGYDSVDVLHLDG